MDTRFLRIAFGTLAIPALLVAGCQRDLPPPVQTTRVMAVETPPPAYPPEVACADVGGRVLIRLTVGTDGRAAGVEMLESSGQPALDASALEAVKTWRFEPATRGGQPAATKINVPVTFTPPVEKPEMCFVLEDRQRSTGN
ncbi:MAG: energy transducer TonB [Lysobacter sp.]|nr:energy transducer TonB [Lysobacter sp.]